MRKPILLLGIFLLIFVNLTLAQQLTQVTQFMDNKLMTNPAYAGSADVACVTCLHRSQWLGLDGAPTTSLVSFHLPLLNKKVGLGMALQRDQLGPTTNWEFDMMYSYRVPLGKGKLALGLLGKIKRYIIDVPSLRATSGSDPIVEGVVQSKILPNFGGGIYYEAPNWYLGIGLHDLARNDLNLSIGESAVVFGREEMHLFAMAGLVLTLSEKVKLKPAAMFKYVKNAPFDIDLNLSAIFMEKFTLGTTYRMGGFQELIGESIDIMVQYQINERIKIGMAYDFSVGMIKNVSSGTWEGLVRYCFETQTEGITNPRFF